MTGLHHLTAARRALLLVLLVCALAVRAAVPAGWMPMAQADGGTRLVLCSGSDTGPAMTGMASGGAMNAASPDAHRDPAAPGTAHDCPFAVTALAVDLAIPITPPIMTPLASVDPAVVAPALLPGRGLAAPPPPATGPPAFA